MKKIKKSKSIYISEAHSLEMTQGLIRTAIDKRFNSNNSDNFSYVHVKEIVTDDKTVTFKKDDKYWKLSYSIDEQNIVTLIGDPVQVEPVFVEISVVSTLPITEAIDKTGKAWRVIIVEAGVSGNGFFYTEAVLNAAVSKFEGARALLRSDEEHLNRTNKSGENLIGLYKNVEFSNGAIRADFHITESDKAINFRNNLKSAWDLGAKDFMGLSMVVRGKITPKRIGNRVVKVVDVIETVSSVDVVVDPSAGGRFVEIAEANNNNKEDIIMNREAMLAMLKKHGIEVKDNATDADLEGMISEAMKSDSGGSEHDKNKVDDVKDNTTTDSGGINISEAKQLRIDVCNINLNTKLTNSGLPKETTDIIESKFAGTIFDVKALDSDIAYARKIAAAASNSGDVIGMGGNAQEMQTSQDRIVKALDGFFSEADVDGVPRFKSARKAYKAITGDSDVTGLLKDATNMKNWKGYLAESRQWVSESLATGNLTQIFGDSIARRMLAEYKLPSLQDWRKIVSSVVSVSDFRTNRRMRMGGYANLPTVGQGGTYQSLTSPTDEEATYAPTKKGGLEDLTIESIANDDVGALRRIPVKLGRAAANTLYRFVFDFIVNNAAVTYDSVTLFHASSHGANLATTALSAVSLQAATQVMLAQSAYNNSTEILNLMPKWLLIPNELDDTAFRLTESGIIIGATNNAGTEPNIHATRGLTPLRVPYWTDANDWALVADPKEVPTIEIGFLNGKEDPELFVQDNPSNGSMFTADKITYKIRHIFGGAVLDHRGMTKNEVA